jgi:biopolymer transport protein TolR
MAFASFDSKSPGTPMSEINMVPLIDVMLVLLVIFIITAPLMTSSLKLDLPKTDSGTPTSAPAFIALAINADGVLFFGDEPLARDALALRIAEAAKANPQLEVQLRADQTVPYGSVAELIALVQQAGLNRIGFVTEAPR